MIRVNLLPARRCSICGKMKRLFNTGRKECVDCIRDRTLIWQKNNASIRKTKHAAEYVKNGERIRAEMTVKYADDPRVNMLYRTKRRAAKIGVPFDLTTFDVQIPETCPALGIPLRVSPGVLTDNSPSIDRLVPKLGYVPGNIHIISNRANRIKTDAMSEELRLVADWIDRMMSR
jgi:hypothetical protein